MIQTLTWTCLFGAVTAVWVAVVALHGTGRRFSSQDFAGVAVAAAAAQIFLILGVSQRRQTDLGAALTYDSRVLLISQLLTVLIDVAAIAAILSARGKLEPTALAIVSSVWAFALLRFVSGFIAAPRASASDSLKLALLTHAVAAGVSGRSVVVRWARMATRTVTFVSLVSAVIAPGWAFIGAASEGYDRTLGGLPRLVGLAPHPGALASVSAVALLIEVGAGRPGRRSLRVLGVFAALLCLLLSQSRTVYVAVPVALAVLALVRWPAVRLVAAGGCTVVLPILLMVRPGWVTPSWLGQENQITTLTGREAIWRIAVEEWHRHPLIGYGPGFLNDDYRRSHLVAEEQWAVHSHNQFFQTLAETGILGILGLCAIILSAGILAWRVRSMDNGLGLSLMILMIIVGFTDTPLRPVGIVLLPVLVVFTVLATPLTFDKRDDADNSTEACSFPPATDLTGSLPLTGRPSRAGRGVVRT